MAKSGKIKRDHAAKVLGEILKQRGRVRIPQVVDLSAAFIDAMGGVRKFANELVAQYNASPVGGMARAKILQTVLAGLKGGEGDRPDLERLSTPELVKLLQAQMNELLGVVEADDGEAAEAVDADARADQPDGVLPRPADPPAGPPAEGGGPGGEPGPGPDPAGDAGGGSPG